MRPTGPALVHERFRRVVERATVRADESHRAHLDRFRAARAAVLVADNARGCGSCGAWLNNYFS